MFKLSRKITRHKVYGQLKMLVWLIIALLAFGTIGYMIVKGTDASKSFGLTLETLAFEHEQEESPFGRFLQISLLLFGVFILWFVLWTFLDLILEGKLHDYWKEVKAIMTTERLKKHYIVCGAGRVGMHAAELLNERNIPCVIIDINKDAADLTRKKGFNVIHGDALEEEVLKEAGAEKAVAVLAMLRETEKNVLITLTAKHINPHAMVYARSEKENMVKQLHNAGAKHVIIPEEAGAKEVVDYILREQCAPKEFK